MNEPLRYIFGPRPHPTIVGKSPSPILLQIDQAISQIEDFLPEAVLIKTISAAVYRVTLWL